MAESEFVLSIDMSATQVRWEVQPPRNISQGIVLIAVLIILWIGFFYLIGGMAVVAYRLVEGGCCTQRRRLRNVSIYVRD